MITVGKPRSTEVVITPERWRRIEEMYHAACERRPEQRGVFLAETCQDDSELRRDVELLV